MRTPQTHTLKYKADRFGAHILRTKKHKKVQATIPEGAKSFKVKIKMRKKKDKKFKRSGVSFGASKARDILREPNPTLRGNPITARQQRWLGWQAGGAKPRTKKRKKIRKAVTFHYGRGKYKESEEKKTLDALSEAHRGSKYRRFKRIAQPLRPSPAGDINQPLFKRKIKRKKSLLSQMKKYKKGSGKAYKLFKSIRDKGFDNDKKAAKKMLKNRIKAVKQSGGGISRTNWPFLKGEAFTNKK